MFEPTERAIRSFIFMNGKASEWQIFTEFDAHEPNATELKSKIRSIISALILKGEIEETLLGKYKLKEAK